MLHILYTIREQDDALMGAGVVGRPGKKELHACAVAADWHAEEGDYI